VRPGQILPGKRYPRVWHDKKLFQYNWYTKILNTTDRAPLIFLHRDDFSANRLKKLRRDIQVASEKLLRKAEEAGQVLEPPTLTVVRTSIFGAALRNHPNVNLDDVEKIIDGVAGGYAVLSLPVLDPPLLNAVLRAMERSVPPRPPKTAAEIAKELEEKTADPAQPGRRMKRQRAVLIPDLKVLGALVEGQVLLPDTMKEVSKLPTLDTLRAQIVGLLTAPSAQLAAILSQASGGQLARTLEGFKKALEDGEAPEKVS
jgi:ribosomal protein L10